MNETASRGAPFLIWWGGGRRLPHVRRPARHRQPQIAAPVSRRVLGRVP